MSGGVCVIVVVISRGGRGRGGEIAVEDSSAVGVSVCD